MKIIKRLLTKVTMLMDRAFTRNNSGSIRDKRTNKTEI